MLSPLSMTDIDIALYGLWQANVRLYPGDGVQSLPDTRSGHRKIPDRQIISAVLVLSDEPQDGDLYGFIYHNYWASIPLPKNVFTHKKDFHFVKIADPDARPEKWVRLERELDYPPAA